MGPYEAVTAYPAGESTAARFALSAADRGYSGVVVRNAAEASLDGEGPNHETIADEYDIDVADAVEIRAGDRSAASARITAVRDDRTLVLVRGSRDLNRFACEEPQVDVLSRPMADGDVNHVLARAAKRNGVRFEFDLGRVCRLHGGRRVQALADLRKLREIVFQYDAPYVVSATPGSHLELRGPRALGALGEVVGFTEAEIEAGLAEWGRLVDRNREVMSEAFIEPGVRRGRYEEDDRRTR
ncbi:RNase P subunit p30 family protein [Halococcus hamelinensis]|uniref:Ribonuclease P protein component 3 n=1 Tax=Halococcus hamelinensis 100A6 TaxID=1132509 RepID=M0M5F8_9EURY|nr:RNase P subunit p30 family protein [Halococcus hamelinensis]EMA39600.1 Ribonuclease P [Halococcus hamelinensis 100A6]